MGVSGLNNFVRENNLLKVICISKKCPRKIVVDGSALSYYLYENFLNWKVGGEYSRFASLLQCLVLSLHSNGAQIEVVIFDSMGSHSTSRMKKERRYKERLKTISNYWKSLAKEPYVELELKPSDKRPNRRTVLPPLTHLIAMQTLRNLKIPVILSMDEADKLIATMAFTLKATVLGADSDFMIYNLPQGFIPFDGLTTKKGTLRALLYQRSTVAKHLGINETWFPLLSCALGNDYVPFPVLCKLASFSHAPITFVSSTKVKKAIHALQQLDQKYSLVDATYAFLGYSQVPIGQLQVFAKMFLPAFNEYKIDPTILKKYTNSYLLDPHGLLSDPFFSSFFFCSPMLEDLSSESVWNVSMPLRSMAYFKYVRSDFVDEHIRKKESFQIKSIPAAYSLHVDLLTRFPNLLHRVLRFLIDTNSIQMYQLLAVIIASNSSVKKHSCEKVYITLEHSHFIAALETCIMCGSMLWRIPIDLHNTVDVPLLHTVLNELKKTSGSIQKVLNAYRSNPESLKTLLQSKHERFVKTQTTWGNDI